MSGARAATALVELRLAATPVATVVLPAGTIVRTQEVIQPTQFQLLEPVVLGAGQSFATTTVEHSVTRTQLHDARGLPDLDILLDYAPFLDGSVSVAAATGTFLEVPTFLNSRADDRHFTVSVDQRDRAMLRFGNGRNGLPPSGTLTITYKTGGGEIGNVDAHRLVVVEGTFHDAFGTAVQVSVDNPDAARGGFERESVALAKLRAPESLRAGATTVTREDFEVQARRVPGVARALMLTSDEDRSIAENSGILYVVPTAGGLPTPALRSAILRMVTETHPCLLTFQVSVQNPVYRPIDVEARVFLRPGQVGATVRERVRANLQAHFRVVEPDGTPNRDVDFGFYVRDAEGNPAAEVAWSDVFDVIRDTEGVRKLGDGPYDLKLNGLNTDVKLHTREFPVLRQVVLLDGASGEVL
jgi:predicted phage baseplate assembly protein